MSKQSGYSGRAVNVGGGNGSGGAQVAPTPMKMSAVDLEKIKPIDLKAYAEETQRKTYELREKPKPNYDRLAFLASTAQQEPIITTAVQPYALAPITRTMVRTVGPSPNSYSLDTGRKVIDFDYRSKEVESSTDYSKKDLEYAA